MFSILLFITASGGEFARVFLCLAKQLIMSHPCADFMNFCFRSLHLKWIESIVLLFHIFGSAKMDWRPMKNWLLCSVFGETSVSVLNILCWRPQKFANREILCATNIDDSVKWVYWIHFPNKNCCNFTMHPTWTDIWIESNVSIQCFCVGCRRQQRRQRINICLLFDCIFRCRTFRVNIHWINHFLLSILWKIRNNSKT